MPGLLHFALQKLQKSTARSLERVKDAQQLNPTAVAWCVVLVERPVSPFCGIMLRTGRKTLTATSKKPRDQAESIFSKAQTQSMSLNRIISEQDAV
ncbi:MAG: hypothetical protein E5X64_42875, partial [Mesorhizobium sp.]